MSATFEAISHQGGCYICVLTVNPFCFGFGVRNNGFGFVLLLSLFLITRSPDDQYEEHNHYQDSQQYGDGGQADYTAIDGEKGYASQDPSELLQFVKMDPADNCMLCGKYSQATEQNTRNHFFF